MGTAITAAFYFALTACVFFALWPYIVDWWLFKDTGSNVAVSCVKPHGLKAGDKVMLTTGDGFPLAGDPWYTVVGAPSETTLLLTNTIENREV